MVVAAWQSINSTNKVKQAKAAASLVIHTAQALESTFAKVDSSKSKPQADSLSSRADETLFPSSRASETSVAIHSLESIFQKWILVTPT
ncbi:Uncharacterised protein [Helicobacter canis]|uniref:Uncharacterized protein n=1 Tax=Helicobacter canis TaxID=29419 RepID=A0A377J2C6_9HELI|nr:Uncharacterised protein [Helicobacter canis]